MSDLTARLDATAREALGALLAYHRGHITRIEAALEALDGPVVPLVRPPAPDIIAPPVEMPNVPQREQRPAAKVDGRAEANRAMPEKRVTCDNCGREFSGLGLGPHRRHCAPTLPKPLPESTPSRTVPPLRSVEVEPTELRGPWTSEPITRMPIDHQAIRNVAAASL